MKTIFDSTTRKELINRIKALNEKNTSAWGKMNLYQMLKHSTLWDEWIQGKTHYKRVLIGRLLGKIMLKNALKDDAPLKHNTPTLSPLIPKEKDGNIEAQKSEWISRIEKYEHYSNPTFVHAFFGKMSKEQIGQFVYKHIDHHLRQFNG